MTYTGFGTRWFDYDNDGNLDLFVANGAVRMTRLAEPTEYPYHQINQLFHNDGHGNYRETTARCRSCSAALGGEPGSCLR